MVSQVVVQLPTAVPSNASPTVDPTFASFAFEARSFYHFAGPKGSPNILSKNIIASIAERTNTRPVIRVGGTSMNFSVFDPNQTEPLKFPKGNEFSGIPMGLKIGPSYFDSFANIDADYMLNLPMRKVSTVGDTVPLANSAYSRIGSERIIAMELGNEVNWYDKPKVAPYTPQIFARQFSEFSTALAQALDFELDRKVWIVGAILGAAEKWQSEVMYDAGLSKNAQRIAGYSAHYYQKLNHFPIHLPGLMNHNAMKTKVDRFTPSIDYLSTLQPPVPFSFDEVGCSLVVPNSPTNDLARSFGAALWQVDFMLYSMTKGVQRVNLQSGLGFRFSLWQPEIPGVQPAEVYANLYAHLFVADFISTSGATQAVYIDVDGKRLAAYAAYEHGRLTRVALLNLRYYDGNACSERDRRGQQCFAVHAPSGSTGVIVKRLTSKLGATAIESTDITWAGESWSAQSDGIGQLVDTQSETVEVDRMGCVKVVVSDSECIMLQFRTDR